MSDVSKTISDILCHGLPEVDISELHIITINELFEKLLECCAWLNDTVPSSFGLLLGCHDHKSESWVGKMMLSHMRTHSIHHTVFHEHGSIHAALLLGLKKFVVFDDASYYGLQMYRIVLGMRDCIQRSGTKDVTLYICVPFMSLRSLSLLSDLVGPLRVVICPKHNIIPDLSGNDDKTGFQPTLYLTFMEYKLPFSIELSTDIRKMIETCLKKPPYAE